MRLTNYQVRVLKSMREGWRLYKLKSNGICWMARGDQYAPSGGRVNRKTVESLRNHGLIRIDLSGTHYVRYALTTKCENSTIVGTQLT